MGKFRDGGEVGGIAGGAGVNGSSIGGAGGNGSVSSGGGSGSSSSGGGSSGRGGADYGVSGTGLTTGTNWSGNTAFGNSGGMATGYATRDYGSLNRAGMGPTSGEYSRFTTLSGNPMFGNSPVQGQSFSGMGAGQAFNKAQNAYNSWKNSQVTQGPLDRPTIDAPNPSVPAVNSPVPPKPKPKASISTALGFLPGWPGTGQWWGNQPPWNNDATQGPRQGVPGTRSTDSTEGGYPSLRSPGPYYATGGSVRSALLTARGLSKSNFGNAVVVNQKGNVVSGKLKSGPIVQVGTGGNVMKRGTIKITWGS